MVGGGGGLGRNSAKSLAFFRARNFRGTAYNLARWLANKHL